jgi:Flp pilus assembly protein TadD
VGRRHYELLAAIAASIALFGGCTSQTTVANHGEPLGGRWWVTTSPPPSGATTPAGEIPSTGSDVTSATGRTNPLSLKKPASKPESGYRQLTHAVTQNPVSQAVGGAVVRSATWVKTKTASLRQPRVQAAEDTISLAHKSPPPGADLYVAMARLNEQGGKTEQAVSLYEEALKKDPKHLEAMLGLAHLLDREGRFDLAIEQYRKATQAHPDDPTAHNDCGLCFARNGDMDDAISELTRAVTLRPHGKLYRNNLATVLVEQGRNDEALEHLAAAHGKAVAHYNLGVLLHQRGRDQQAAEQFAAALQVNPKLEPARTSLARLNGQSCPAVGGPQTDAGTVAMGPQVVPPPGSQAAVRSPGTPTDPQLGPVVDSGSPRGVPFGVGVVNPSEVPARPVYPETWRSQATGDGPVHLPELRGPEQAVLPPTPDDIQRYPTSGLSNGPRPY